MDPPPLPVPKSAVTPHSIPARSTPINATWPVPSSRPSTANSRHSFSSAVGKGTPQISHGVGGGLHSVSSSVLGEAPTRSGRSTTTTPRAPSSIASAAGTSRVSTRSQSRVSGAASARPGTAGSFGEGGDYVVALIRGKSAGVEVGLAAMNLGTGRMTLTQVADSASYPKTHQYLAVHRPRTVLVAESELSAVVGLEGMSLVESIENQFQIKCLALQRPQWNADNGLDLLKQYCVDDDRKRSVLSVSATRYYALCAVSALLLYVSAKHGISLQPSSVMIKYETARGQMFIDAESARNLELVQNNLTTKSSNTLFSTLNSCYTAMGTRLLRSSILQPSNSASVIDKRLDVVEELINAPDKLRAIRKNLKPLEGIDFDRLIASFSHNKHTDGDHESTEHRISLLLQLRTVVNILPEMASVLTNSISGILDIAERVNYNAADRLADLVQAFSDPDLFAMRDIIEERITIEATLGDGRRSKRLAAKTTRMYAIREHCNPLLDIARDTYRENEADIMELAKELEDELGITARLEWTEGGYRFFSFSEDLVGISLPKELVNIEYNKRGVKFSTRELLKRNARLLQSQQEVFNLSQEVVQQLMEEVVKHISCLYQCSDAIALVDMLAGFAVISAAHQCTRPKFGKSLELKNCRHPILETTLPAGDCVANDVFAADGPANFQLIQGPNMSGKSTYLRQIGLLTVQAMVGCFVPAERATFKLHDALLTRLSNDDHIEKSLSTFAAEMSSAATILGVVTSRSLVLIDELGRGTAPIEGVGLSHAIAERLIKTRAFVFFVTHFKELSQTLCTHPGVVMLHLQVQKTSMDEDDEFSTTFQYKVVEGTTKEEHYGLELAKLAALPREVMATAWKVARKLNDLEEMGRNASLANAQAMRRKAIIELRGRLQNIIQTARGNDQQLYSHLMSLRKDLIETLKAVQVLQKEAAENDEE